MTEPLRFRRRRRLPADRPCRACRRRMFGSSSVVEFSHGPDGTEVFHPSCAPTADTRVPICPECLRVMHTPTWWDVRKGKADSGVPVCLRCTPGAA